MRKRKQLGPVLFQLPPNFKADVPLLRDFLAQLPRGMKYAVEFRHDSWFNDATYRALKKRNVALCIAETESITTPEERTAEFAYFRFRRPSYKPAERRKLVDRVERCLADGLETYAFFKHDEDPRSPLNAMELLKALRKKLPGGISLVIPAIPATRSVRQGTASESVEGFAPALGTLTHDRRRAPL